jgi:hypothetical protein
MAGRAYGPLSSLCPSVSATAPWSLYSPLSLLLPSVLSTALCLLYIPMYSLRPSFPSIILGTLFGPVFPLWPSTTFYSLLWPSVPSAAQYPHYGLCFLISHLFSLLRSASLQPSSLQWPSVPFKALCPLHGPLSPLQPSVPSMALYPV